MPRLRHDPPTSCIQRYPTTPTKSAATKTYTSATPATRPATAGPGQKLQGLKHHSRGSEFFTPEGQPPESVWNAIVGIHFAAAALVAAREHLEMAELGPLLEVAELDLESDRLNDRHANMPEREALRQCELERAALARERSEIASRHADLAGQEETLGREVATIAAKSADVEKTLYSGTVKVTKELEALQEELRLLKVRQGELEEQEMELLEAIEGVDGEEARAAAADGKSEIEARRLEKQIAATEAEIAETLTRIEAQRATLVAGIPLLVLTKYAALRDKPRLGGRAAARLGAGICEGCRVRLPVMEYQRMKDEPPDALIQCSGCRRVLVRIG